MGHTYTDTRPRHPAILADMKMELIEAEEDMQKKWLIYRDARPNSAALEAYTDATERCAELKASIFNYQRGGAK